MPSRKNRLESLLLLASRERWCWDLWCTTCGHEVFRWGLVALARGLDPEAQDWPIHADDSTDRDRWEQLLGPLPRQAFPLVDQRFIQDAARGCQLKHIARAGPFPDWLGYLGLVLRHTEDEEAKNLKLTQQFVPQLMQMIPPDHAGFLGELLTRQIALRWEHLERVERVLPERPSRPA